MSGAPRRVFVHIGLHKTGTTYLQNLMRANVTAMAAQGVEFSWGKDRPVQAFAVWDLQGRRPRDGRDNRIAGQWQALVDATNVSGQPTALISEERLSLCTLRQIRRCVHSFPDSEVHVVVTVRDLARVAVSAWQEEVKNDNTWTWEEFAASVRDMAQRATNPARGFWLRQDVVKICEAWETAVPAERIHVITVPPSGSSPGLLMERFASVVGFDPDALSKPPPWNNENMGTAATEVVRRVNARLGGRLNQAQHDQVVKMSLAKMLARRSERARTGIPEDDLPWVTDRAQTVIGGLRSHGYPVVGDLEELLPQQPQGARRPGEVSEHELLEASLDALAMLSEKYAKAWWHQKWSADTVVQQGGVGSRLRGLVFRGQRKGAELADRNPVAAWALRGVLDARDRARARARVRARNRTRRT